MALPRGTDVENVGMNSSGGQTLGATTSELAGFHGSACDQAAAITSATILAQNSGFGFSTSAEMTAAMTAINSILTALREKGILAT